MTPQLIGVLGKARHGKDTVANRLINEYGYERSSFSDPLKEMLVRALHACPPPPEIMPAMTLDELADAIYVNRTPFTRWLLQFIGTNIIRHEVSRDFWVDQWAVKAHKKLAAGRKLVIPDVRFINEAQRLKEMRGKLWKIIRTDAPDAIEHGAKHESEMQMESIQPDVTIACPTGIELVEGAVDGLVDGWELIRSLPVVGYVIMGVTMALERKPPTESEVNAKRAEEKFLREQELADLRAVLSTPEGRRLVWRLLEHAGILRTIFDPDPRVSAFKEGGRNEGHWLYAEVMTAGPEQFIRMLQEHTKRTRGNDG